MSNSNNNNGEFWLAVNEIIAVVYLAKKCFIPGEILHPPAINPTWHDCICNGCANPLHLPLVLPIFIRSYCMPVCWWWLVQSLHCIRQTHKLILAYISVRMGTNAFNNNQKTIGDSIKHWFWHTNSAPAVRADTFGRWLYVYGIHVHVQSSSTKFHDPSIESNHNWTNIVLCMACMTHLYYYLIRSQNSDVTHIYPSSIIIYTKCQNEKWCVLILKEGQTIINNETTRNKESEHRTQNT